MGWTKKKALCVLKSASRALHHARSSRHRRILIETNRDDSRAGHTTRPGTSFSSTTRRTGSTADRAGVQHRMPL